MNTAAAHRWLGHTAHWLRWLWREAAITARLAVGQPDYDTYLQHQQRSHPDQTAMSREEFFHERLQARYGKGRSRCC